MKTDNVKKAERPKSPKIPKAINLLVRMIVADPKPDKNGRWLFKAVLPDLGTQAPDIRAKTAKGARRVLENLIRNGLDDRDDEWTADASYDKEH